MNHAGHCTTPIHPIPPAKRALLSHIHTLTTALGAAPAQESLSQSAQYTPSPKYSVKFGVPDAMVLIKHKYLEHQTDAKVKVREVIRHGSHHFKSLARKMSRCISVLWKFVTAQPSSIEVLAMHEIKTFVEQLRKQTQQGEQARNALWGELDVEEMFPNIPKPLIAQAVSFYWGLLCRQKQGTPKDFVFFLHKSGDKTLDHVARLRKTDAYLRFTLHDLLAFIQWDLCFNARLVSFSSIYNHTTGCPMGGSCSAQYASLVLNYLERDVDWSTLPPICRYGDNYLLFMSPSWTPVRGSCVPPPPPTTSPQLFMSKVKRVIEKASSMKLTVEGWGKSIPFLESQIFFTNGVPDIGLREPTFTATPGDSTPPADARLMDRWSPNVLSLLHSLVPNFFKKCAFYHFSPLGFVNNVRIVTSVFARKLYPAEWWKPCLMAKSAGYDLVRG